MFASTTLRERTQYKSAASEHREGSRIGAHYGEEESLDPNMPMPTQRRGLLMASALFGTEHLEAANGARSKARPRSASINAAAWKAYGSPRLRGAPRKPVVPDLMHPNPKTSVIDSLPGRPASAMVRGGGYTMDTGKAGSAAGPAFGGRPGTAPAVSMAGARVPEPPAQMSPTGASRGQRQQQCASPTGHMPHGAYGNGNGGGGGGAHDSHIPLSTSGYLGVGSSSGSSSGRDGGNGHGGAYTSSSEHRLHPTLPSDPRALSSWQDIQRKLAAGERSGSGRGAAAGGGHTHGGSGFGRSSKLPSSGSGRFSSVPMSSAASSSSAARPASAHASIPGRGHGPVVVAGYTQPEAEFASPVLGGASLRFSRLSPSSVARLAGGVRLHHHGQHAADAVTPTMSMSSMGSMGSRPSTAAPLAERVARGATLRPPRSLSPSMPTPPPTGYQSPVGRSIDGYHHIVLGQVYAQPGGSVSEHVNEADAYEDADADEAWVADAEADGGDAEGRGGGGDYHVYHGGAGESTLLASLPEEGDGSGNGDMDGAAALHTPLRVPTAGGAADTYHGGAGVLASLPEEGGGGGDDAGDAYQGNAYEEDAYPGDTHHGGAGGRSQLASLREGESGLPREGGELSGDEEAGEECGESASAAGGEAEGEEVAVGAGGEGSAAGEEAERGGGTQLRHAEGAGRLNADAMYGDGDGVDTGAAGSGSGGADEAARAAPASASAGRHGASASDENGGDGGDGESGALFATTPSSAPGAAPDGEPSGQQQARDGGSSDGGGDEEDTTGSVREEDSTGAAPPSGGELGARGELSLYSAVTFRGTLDDAAAAPADLGDDDDAASQGGFSFGCGGGEQRAGDAACDIGGNGRGVPERTFRTDDIIRTVEMVVNLVDRSYKVAFLL
ncbi:hypothetical protein FOA52_013142 [Chlamydomonas sp. UWO 241]|nr:hypothetical protein FOA52_013142 [Chlamydomonas sp. UWO 241]